ncbi:hypothetical protein BVY04_03295 [bacterium M21]|nr:hypothetical protein BVY04_03295 [bacterium M21]
MSDDSNAKIIRVLIGQVSLTRSPNLLQSVLGSCIGLAIFDPKSGIAGMAHILLPSSEGRKLGKLPGKYADCAVPCLYDALLKFGAVPQNLKAKIAGGARMFSASNNYDNGRDIGSTNAEAVKAALKKFHIPMVAHDIGGTAGRKVEFELATYKMTIEDFSKRTRLI